MGRHSLLIQARGVPTATLPLLPTAEQVRVDQTLQRGALMDHNYGQGESGLPKICKFGKLSYHGYAYSDTELH